MREFFKISPQFWTGETGRVMRKTGKNCQLLAAFLCCSPQANSLGVYYLPLAHVTEVALTPKEVRAAMYDLCEIGFCSYDQLGEFIWVYEMAKHQIGTLKANDRMVQYVNREYRQLPKNPFLAPFFDRYCEPLRLVERRVSDSPSQALGKGLASPCHGQMSLSLAADNDAARVKRGRQTFPADFAVSPAVRDWAAQNDIHTDLDKEFEAFKDYHISRASTFADWDGALRTWLRNVRRFTPRAKEQKKAGELSARTQRLLARGLT